MHKINTPQKFESTQNDDQNDDRTMTIFLVSESL